MERIIEIGGKAVKMRCTALLPRIYRHRFGHDLIVDMQALREHYNRAVLAEKDTELTDDEKAEAQLSIIDLEIFENIAWLFVRAGEPETTPDSPDEWLDTLDGMFSIYEVLPEIFSLWRESQKTTSTPKN